MNKYQEKLFPGSRVDIFAKVNGNWEKCEVVEESVESKKYKQNFDITITEYKIECNYKFEYCVEGKWSSTPAEEAIFAFDKPVTEIRLVNAFGLCDPLVIKIDFELADKEAYFAQKKADDYAALLASAKIKHSTGNGVLNIYFQPCADSYAKTNVKLFVPDTFERKPGPYGPHDVPATWNLIKNIDVPAEDFYVAVNNLAYGTYSYVLKQVAADGTVLIETEHIEVHLKRPPVDNGKPWISI